MKKNIYMDHNATYPTLPHVIDEMTSIMKLPCNSSSVHSFGKRAKSLIDKARIELLELLNLDSDLHRVIFTSTGTESNNLAITGLEYTTFITSSVEHSSVLKAANHFTISVDENGVLDLEELDLYLAQHNQTALLSIQIANQETGVLQDIKAIHNVVKKYNCFLHIDASQACGKTPLNLNNSCPDMITVSGHKFGGPLGAAALVLKKTLNLNATIKGGGQEYGMRSGSCNVPAIHGFGVAANIAKKSCYEFAKLEDLRNFIELEIRNICSNAKFPGSKAKRLVNTSNIIMPNLSNQTQVIAFDIAGIAVSAGSACSSGVTDVSHVLTAMGYSKKEASCAIRVSLGLENDMNEAKEFINQWGKLFLSSQNN